MQVEAELGKGDAAGGSSGAADEEEGEISDDMELLGDEDFEDIGDIGTSCFTSMVGTYPNSFLCLSTLKNGHYCGNRY